MQTYELLSRSGKVFWTGCVICTGGGCNVVRWINHPALIVAKLFERTRSAACGSRVCTLCRFLLFCFLEKKGVGGGRIQTVENDLYLSEGTIADSVVLNYCLFDILIFLGRELFPLPFLFFFFLFSSLDSAWDEKGGEIKKKEKSEEWIFISLWPGLAVVIRTCLCSFVGLHKFEKSTTLPAEISTMLFFFTRDYCAWYFGIILFIYATFFFLSRVYNFYRKLYTRIRTAYNTTFAKIMRR